MGKFNFMIKAIFQTENNKSLRKLYLKLKVCWRKGGRQKKLDFSGDMSPKLLPHPLSPFGWQKN